MGKILIIDDERSIRNTLKDVLEYEGYGVELAESGREGIAKCNDCRFDAVMCDIKMAEIDGIEVLSIIKTSYPDLPVLMISGHGNIHTAVTCIKHGAFDFIEKPIDLNKLLEAVKIAINTDNIVKNTAKAIPITRKKGFGVEEIIGESKPIVRVKMMIDRVAPSEARVLITGDNGTGKELVARWLHQKSGRCTAPFVEVNCAAIPSDLIESELFGHEKGAFTSAVKDRKGKFYEAHGGTIFLDEIGDMSLSAQAKVLRVLQENKISRVGGDKDIDINVRVLAATNKNLKQEIAERNFREDLYHRLSVIEIHVPALRERIEDLDLLVPNFIEKICRDYAIPSKSIEKEAIDELKTMPWSGNIRELKNVVERLIVLSDDLITLEDVKLYALGIN